jgi:hypothetical protein
VGPRSILGEVTFDLFGGPLDAAVNIDVPRHGPSFSDLELDYYFGKGGNLNRATNTATFNATAGNPLWFGMYRTGPRPWSLFNGFYKADTGLEVGDEVLYGGLNAVDINPGPDTNWYYWYNTVTTTDYKTPFFTRLADQALFLTGSASRRMGLYATVDMTFNSNPLLNFTETFVDQYNTAGAGVKPAVADDYTRTTENTNKDTDNTIFVGVPLYFGTDGTSHVIDINSGYNWIDLSTNNVITYTVPQDPADTLGGAATQTEENSFTRISSSIPLGLDYTLTRPGLFDKNPENRFSLGAMGSGLLHLTSFAEKLAQQDVTFAPGGSFTNAGRNDDDTTYAGGGTLEWGAAVWASHSFYREAAPFLHLACRPTLNLGASFSQNNPGLNSIVDVNRTDGTGDGLYDAAGDTIVTTTTNYFNGTINSFGTPANKVTDLDMSASFTMPSAVMYKPHDDSMLGLFYGLRPTISLVNTITTTTDATFRQTVRTEDGTGALVSENITQPQAADVTTENRRNWTFSLVHRIGAQIDLAENATLYVETDFTALSIQGIFGKAPKEE